MYEPSRVLLSFHIAGFQYADGALVLGDLKAGDKLTLRAERDNPHDPEAVVRSNALVNGVNNLAVHLLDRGERPIHIVQDIRIAQVQVGGKPHHRLCPHFATRLTRA